MSWLSARGEEPIQTGSSQLLFPVCSILVGLVGALIARSYICTKKRRVHIIYVGMDESSHVAVGNEKMESLSPF